MLIQCFQRLLFLFLYFRSHMYPTNFVSERWKEPPHLKTGAETRPKVELTANSEVTSKHNSKKLLKWCEGNFSDLATLELKMALECTQRPATELRIQTCTLTLFDNCCSECLKFKAHGRQVKNISEMSQNPPSQPSWVGGCLPRAFFCWFLIGISCNRLD